MYRFLFSLVVFLPGCLPAEEKPVVPSAWDWAEAEVGKDNVAWNGPLPLIEGDGGVAAAPLPSVGSPSSPGVPWCGYREAVSLSRETGRPLWFHIYGPPNTCPVCKIQEEKVFPTPEVAEVAGGFVAVRLPLGHKWAKAMGVTMTPTDVFFKPGETKDGKRVPAGKLKTPQAYVEHLQKYLSFFGGQTT